MEYDKINEQTKQKQTHRYRKKLMVTRWEVGGWVKKMIGLGCTNWQLQNSHGDVKYSIGNIVDNTVIITYGVRWCKTYRRITLLSYKDVYPLCCPSETTVNTECQLQFKPFLN